MSWIGLYPIEDEDRWPAVMVDRLLVVGLEVTSRTRRLSFSNSTL
jgi:hypothetical protein